MPLETDPELQEVLVLKERKIFYPPGHSSVGEESEGVFPVYIVYVYTHKTYRRLHLSLYNVITLF